MCETFRTMPKATIVKLEGRVGGGGSELSLSCDMRFAAIGRAVLNQPEVALGIIPGGSGTQRLPRLMGRSRALEVVLGCEDFDAAAAERYGWVNRALPADEIGPFVERLARRIASFPPHAVAAAKASVLHHDGDMTEALRQEGGRFNATLGEPVTQSAMRRFFTLGGQTAEGEMRLGDLAGELGMAPEAAPALGRLRSTGQTVETVLGALAFPEGPRWHDGRLYFSDMHAHEVVAVSADGHRETVATVPNQPSGLGWLPDGRMLVVSMTDRRVLRQEANGDLVTHADLAALAPFHCNDMVVDGRGNAYVGNFGFDLFDRAVTPCDTNLILVEPSGRATSVADGLAFPNGAVITADGATLIVGESQGRRLTAFTIAADGTLFDRRVWAELAKPTIPDGICLDAEGMVWAACPRTGVVQRIREGGEVVDLVELDDGYLAYACMLGGDDGTTLFICAAPTADPSRMQTRTARILAVRVAVPGAGWP